MNYNNQGPAETQSRTAPQGREGARKNSLQPCTPRWGAGEGEREGGQLCLTSARSKECSTAWPGAETGRVWVVEVGGGWRWDGVWRVLGSARGREIPWIPEGEVSVINLITWYN